MNAKQISTPKPHQQSARHWLTMFVLLLTVFFGQAVMAQAAVYTVTKTADTNDGACDADCSLREAIVAANAASGDDTINFAAALAGQTIVLTSGELVIANNGSLTINGLQTGGGVTVSGNNQSRVFSIRTGATATISYLTITGGNATNNFGGGIYNDGGTLTLNNATVSNNSALFGGGILNRGGTVTLKNSTVSNNSATLDGGGIYNVGTLTLNNATVSNNSAQNVAGSIANGSPVATINLNNSIIANSTSGGDCGRFSGTINAEYSLIEDGLACVNGTNSNNLTGDPLLGPLQNNGGPTQTHALLPGSPAIDAGNSSLTTDQRGLLRPVDQPDATYPDAANASDIGAFELQTIDTDGDGIPDECDIDQNPGATDFDRDGIVDSSVCDTEIGPPTDKEQCKQGGWQLFDFPRTFRNQGDCIQFVNTGR